MSSSVRCPKCGRVACGCTAPPGSIQIPIGSAAKPLSSGALTPGGEQRGVYHGDAEGATSASRSRTSPAATTGPLTHIEVEQLAAYNTRVYQGIVHTEETKARMAELQHRFDTAGYTPRRRRKLRAWRPDE